MIAAFDVITKHVETRAGRREQDDVARLRVRGRRFDRFFERAAVLPLAGSLERGRQTHRITTDEQCAPHPTLQGLGERREILALAIATGDQQQISRHAAHRGSRRTDVGALGIVDVAYSALLAHPL